MKKPKRKQLSEPKPKKTKDSLIQIVTNIHVGKTTQVSVAMGPEDYSLLRTISKDTGMSHKDIFLVAFHEWVERNRYKK
ncbi:hypothetical protein [Acinetobacter junii]|uniref:hypothetical protein n=1 Tax=Acinetobacter junii TaxID=40215 RepID=UPI000F66E6FB|nr:hypothetical protein [Acinetobacter junii]RSE36463.1 hypothetical protein EGT64_07645 [Acinetobacter junii]